MAWGDGVGELGHRDNVFSAPSAPETVSPTRSDVYFYGAGCGGEPWSFCPFSDDVTEPSVITPTVWLLTGFIIVFTVSIAIFKDVPDLEGDRQYQITTFTILLGKKRIFQLSLGIIFACYAGMILGEITMTTSLNQLLFIGCHLILGALLWWRSRQIDLESKKSIASFYQFIWKLFFLEYLLFPLAHWL